MLEGKKSRERSRHTTTLLTETSFTTDCRLLSPVLSLSSFQSMPDVVGRTFGDVSMASTVQYCDGIVP